MAWRIVKQPNGLFARFSDIVDNFTHWNMSKEDIICMCKMEHNMNSSESQIKLQNAIDNDERWSDAINTIRIIHSKNAVQAMQEGIAEES